LVVFVLQGRKMLVVVLLQGAQVLDIFPEGGQGQIVTEIQIGSDRIHA